MDYVHSETRFLVYNTVQMLPHTCKEEFEGDNKVGMYITPKKPEEKTRKEKFTSKSRQRVI